MALLLTVLALAGPAEAARPPHPWHPGHHKGCHTHKCDNRMERKGHQRTVNKWWRVVRPLNGYLNSIAQCESGGRWHIATGNGFYGGLQFTASSWWSVGGRGYAHQASPLEQKYRAVLLSRVQGWGAWPVCS